MNFYMMLTELPNYLSSMYGIRIVDVSYFSAQRSEFLSCSFKALIGRHDFMKSKGCRFSNNDWEILGVRPLLYMLLTCRMDGSMEA